MSFFRIAQGYSIRFEKWFEKRFSWFFTNGYKKPQDI
jgi:hypothetical protein